MSNGDVVTIAGSASAAASFADNATGTDARFAGPNGPTTDGSTLWVGDGGNRRIRAIGLSGTFPVATEAGSGTAGDQDGVGVAAQMRDPRGLAFAPDGFVYFVDAVSAVVRRFDPASKQVVTLAGAPFQFASVDGVGSAARFVSPRGMAIEGFTGRSRTRTAPRFGESCRRRPVAAGRVPAARHLVAPRVPAGPS